MGAPPTESLDAAALFQRHADFVACFLSRLGVPPADLDDVVQEVFLVAHARGGYVPGPAKPTSYLGAIAARAASSYRRRRGSQLARMGALPDQVGSDAPDPVQVLQAHESSRALTRALAALDPTLASTLLLVDQEGESCLSVAAATDTPVGTVYWRLHKARKALRQALQAQGEGRAAQVPLRKEVR